MFVTMKKVKNINNMTLETAVLLLEKRTAENETLTKQVEELTGQLEWLKRQIFGQKSERFVPKPDMQQDDLFGFSEG